MLPYGTSAASFGLRGAMPAALAGVLTLLFCAILALYPALSGWIYHALGARSSVSVFHSLQPGHCPIQRGVSRHQ